MISMNIRPPRATAERNVESVPNVNARILNSGSRNIGSATRRSITTNATSDTTPDATRISTRGLPHPVAESPYGRMPYVTAIMIRISPTANVMLPPQSTLARFGVEISWSLR